MAHIIKTFFFLAALAMIFPACENTIEQIDIEQGFDYFPLEVGKAMIYEVDSINYFNKQLQDSTRTYIREEITEVLKDGNGQDFYKIERSIREDVNAPWRIADVWLGSRDDDKAYRTEENLRFIKLIFPLRTSSTWDHNAFIDEDMFVKITGGETIQLYRNWNSSVKELDATTIINGEEFNNVAVVIHADDENVIERRYVEEHYAKGVGLIYREMMILDTQKTDSSDPWAVKADEGFIVRQRLIQQN